MRRSEDNVMWIPGIWLWLSGLRHGGASTFTDRTISAALLQDLSEVRRGKDKTVSLEDFCLISNCEKASNITRPVILYRGQCDIHSVYTLKIRPLSLSHILPLSPLPAALTWACDNPQFLHPHTVSETAAQKCKRSDRSQLPI